jgi:DNA-binding NarL/FixJ family response regulator
VSLGNAEPVAWVGPALRANAAQERINDLEAQVAGEYERRNLAIREAIDGGCKRKELARALGITETTIYRVLGTVD